MTYWWNIEELCITSRGVSTMWGVCMSLFGVVVALVVFLVGLEVSNCKYLDITCLNGVCIDARWGTAACVTVELRQLIISMLLGMWTFNVLNVITILNVTVLLV